MDLYGGFKPSFMMSDGVTDVLPGRGQLSKNEYSRKLIDEHGVVPGSPRYMQKSVEFLPLEVEVGHVIGTNEMVYWCPHDEFNSFIAASGGSGAGKSVFLEAVAGQSATHGIPVVVVDVHGDLKVPYLKDILLSSGSTSSVGLNPLAIEGIDPRKKGLFDHCEALVSMVKRAVPTLSARQRYLLFNAIETAYVAAGIEDHNPRTWGRQPPTFATVSCILDGWMRDPSLKAYRDSIAGCLASLGAIFGHPVFKRSNNLSVSSILGGAVRLDLSQLDERVQVIVAETVLRMTFNALKAMGPISANESAARGKIRLLVVIDETKVLSMGNGDPDKHSNILNVIGTEGRKFGIAGCFASQSSDHFGADLRRNISSWVALRCMDESEARRMAADMRVPASALQALSRPGEGYFRSGSRSVAVHMQVDPLEVLPPPGFAL
ncbi:MAG TPA: hypothetical protein DF427_01015 [Moraxellaceae bacterium]|nr:hypothetical protein [Moraxellaceae bacterium]